MTLSIGFDIGGTFTDFMMFDSDSREWLAEKVRTTPDDHSKGCLEGIRSLIGRAGISPEDVGYVAHGTTVATNTLIERKGARTGLVTTKGFRDVLEIRRQIMPQRYDVSVPKPTPLVSRDLRLEVRERTLANGEIEQEVDPGELRQALEELRRDGCDALAISFLHAYANAANERAAEQAARELAPWTVTSSHRVLNEHREYERTSTAVANAYIAPPMRRYLDGLASGLRAALIEAPLLVFQSNGGLVPAEQAQELPIACLLSGPAAGVIAATAVARQSGLDHFVSLDMGGTSCDVALVDALQPSLAFEQEIAGWPIRIPRLDIHSVGAGGGSIAWVDPGGLLRVGPQSAGAVPGPASYGTGGNEATVTDAHVVLGRLGSRSRLAGGLTLDLEAARTAVGRVGAPLGLDEHEAAAGILDIVNATMVQAVRLISIERGHDPRRYSLIAFGGAGPLHACDLVRAMGLRDAIVPPRPGLLCAMGLLAADLRVEGSMTGRIRLGEADPRAVRKALSEVEGQVRRSVAVRSRPDLEWTPAYVLNMRYSGQSFDLGVPLAHHELQDLDLAALAARFDAVHRAAYGHADPTAPKEIVAYRVSMLAPGGANLSEMPRIGGGAPARPSSRDVFFRGVGWVGDCPVHARESLSPGDALPGPAVIEQMDTTIAVAPDFTARVDPHTNVVLTRAG